MTLCPSRDADTPDAAQEAFLVLELSLVHGDAVSGTIGVTGRRPATPFHGWIDLMSAINTFRADAGKTA